MIDPNSIMHIEDTMVRTKANQLQVLKFDDIPQYETEAYDIYSDKDYTFDTSFQSYKRVLKRYKYLVKEINVYYNLLSKDCGVPKDKIKLQKYSI